MPQKKKSVHPNRHGKSPQMHKGKSKDLLDLEANSSNYFASSIESKLLFCKKDDFLQPQIAKFEKSSILDEKPSICAIPESNVLGKVKDFLGVISEANKRLEFDAMDNSEKYDIEVVNEDESEYIEMDLMLGVADLHTPEAVAAAESAIAGYQATMSLDAGDTSSDEDEDEDEDDDSDDGDDKEIISKAEGKNSSSEALRNQPKKKRSKIVELS